MFKKYIKAQAFDCMQFFYGAVQEPRIRCYIKFNDHIDENILKRAVDLSIEAFPLIGCVLNEKYHNWERRAFTADDIIHLIEISESNENSSLEYLLKSIDYLCEPQLKIFLIRREMYDELCIIINHMISDGAGFKEYLYMLSDLYTKCKRDASYNKKQELSDNRSLNQLLQNLDFSEKNKIFFSKTDNHEQDPRMVIPIEGRSSYPSIVIAKIEKQDFDAMKKFSKEKHVSINDVLLTAYIRAIYRATKCREIAVPCPVDLRKYKKEDQKCGICNLTGNYWCNVEIQSGETFERTLEKVWDQMMAQKESNTCLKEPMRFCMMFYVLPFNIIENMFYSASPIPVTSYSNLGVIDDLMLNFEDHVIDDAFISTAVKSSSYFQLAVSTFKGCCTLTSSLHATKEDREFISSFFDGMISEIKTLLK